MCASGSLNCSSGTDMPLRHPHALRVGALHHHKPLPHQYVQSFPRLFGTATSRRHSTLFVSWSLTKGKTKHSVPGLTSRSNFGSSCILSRNSTDHDSVDSGRSQVHSAFLSIPSMSIDADVAIPVWLSPRYDALASITEAYPSPVYGEE